MIDSSNNNDNPPTKTPTKIFHTALPDSSDLDRVLSTFPTVPSTARSGCPTPKSGVKIGVKGTAWSGYPTPKSGVKIGVKGKPGVQEMNPKKPGVKPEKHSRSGYHKNAYYTDSGASNHVVFNADHLDNKLQEGLGYPSDVDPARAIKYNILGRTTINNIKLGSNNKGMLDKDSYDNDNNASDETFVLDEKKLKEEYKRDRILDEAEENIDGYQDLQGNHFDQVIDEVSEAVNYEAEDKEVFESDEIDREGESVTKDNSVTIKDENSETIKNEEDITDETSTNQPENDTDETPTQQESIPRMEQEIKSNLDSSYWGDGIAGPVLEKKILTILFDILPCNALATDAWRSVLEIIWNYGTRVAKRIGANTNDVGAPELIKQLTRLRNNQSLVMHICALEAHVRNKMIG